MGVNEIWLRMYYNIILYFETKECFCAIFVQSHGYSICNLGIYNTDKYQYSKLSLTSLQKTT